MNKSIWEVQLTDDVKPIKIEADKVEVWNANASSDTAYPGINSHPSPRMGHYF